MVGILSCVVLDLWQRILFLTLGVPVSNWALVGRWLNSFIKTGKWVNHGLPNSPKINNELAIGWLFHYAVSIAYAGLFFVLWKWGIVVSGFFGGLVFGLVSVIIPWFFFMPALGAGVLANKTDNSLKACALALLAHAIYGTAIGMLAANVF